MAEQLRWVEQGEQALAVKDFDKAEELFRLAKDDERLKKVFQARDQLWIEQELAKAAEVQQGGRLGDRPGELQRSAGTSP